MGPGVGSGVTNDVVGNPVGKKEGSPVGNDVKKVGSDEGFGVTPCVGTPDGKADEGSAVGSSVGLLDG